MRIEELYRIYLSHPKICTDSRDIPAGSLFFALKGDLFNGNTFASSAIESGAAFAIIDESIYRKDERYILVENVLSTLQELANYHRKHSGAKVIGITGSNGKTSNKELIRAVLSTSYQTHATIGNLNNHIGVPLTLLSMPEETEFAIIEMGANHQKEIELLCKIAMPDFGLITNVGRAHLEGFGGFEGVMKGKGEMYKFIRNNKGCIFINSGNSYLQKMASGIPNQVSYGSNASDFVSGKIVSSSEDSLEIEWKKQKGDDVYKIHTHMPGVYNFENIMAAVCVGVYFGVADEKICMAIGSYVPVNNRSQLIKRGTNTILADAYNANPSSMEAAIRNFSETIKGDKVMIIGDMMELGEHSDEEHKAILMLIKDLGMKQIVLVGENYSRNAGAVDALCFPNASEAGAWLKKNPFKNTYFLLKGSRKIKLETLIDSI